MLTFFTDEASIHGKEAKHYGLSIYGGLILNEATFRDFTTFIYDLKERKYVLPQELELKWSFRDVWEGMQRVGHVKKGTTAKTDPALYESLKEDYNALKEAVLDKVSESDAKIIFAIRPNKLLGASLRQRTEYSIAAVARKFEKILEKKNSFGVILADELPRRLGKEDVIDYQYILNLCCKGSGIMIFHRLISVVPTINSHVSPIHQINDILLGVMQYYILEFIRKSTGVPGDLDIAKRLLGKVINSFHKSPGGTYTINNGILMYPPKINRRSSAAGNFLNLLEGQLKSDFNIT